MRRPEQHQIDSAGKALLRQVFADWAVNEITEDYGRDFEVEVFRNNNSTGITFSVQLKSSSAPSYSASGDFISQELKRASAQYLCQELRHPVVLIVADTKSQRVFWTMPQLDQDLRKAMNERVEVATFTLRVPTENELPNTLNDLVESLGRVESILASRRLLEVPSARFAISITNQVDTSSLTRTLRDKSDLIDLMRAQALKIPEELSTARAIVNDVLSRAQSSIECKAYALLVREKIETLAVARAGTPQSSLSAIALKTGLDLQALTRKGPAPLKFFSLIARCAAELYSLVQQDWGIYLNWKAHESSGDIWWRTSLKFHRAALVRRIARKYEHCVRLARYAATFSQRCALPRALLKVVDGTAPFIVRLRSEGLDEGAAEYQKSAFEFCKLAAEIAVECDDDESKARAAISAVSLTKRVDDEHFKWAYGLLQNIREAELRESARITIDRQAARLKGIKLPDEVYTGATQERAYENMAHALGIDVCDPNDQTAKLVRIGIADLNPGRVLKNCEHLFVTLGSRGLVSEWLRLHTMGQKVIHCTLHKYQMVGWTLDGIYASFKAQYCVKCPDAAPRPEEWEYSSGWQIRENERNQEYAESYFGRTTRATTPSPSSDTKTEANQDD